MMNSHRDNKFGGGNGGRKFGGKRSFGERSFGGRDGGRPSMHQATCSECGRSCEVPFKPTGDRPVFCSDCFKNNENAGPRRSRGGDFGDRSFGERSFGGRDNGRTMHQAICEECGRSCEVPFRPNGEKPVYCDQCFRKGNSTGGAKTADQNKEQFEILNIKLDRILKALNPVATKESPKEMPKEIKKENVKEKSKEPNKEVSKEKAEPKKAAKKAKASKK